jgi:hypothetical protein
MIVPTISSIRSQLQNEVNNPGVGFSFGPPDRRCGDRLQFCRGRAEARRRCGELQKTEATKRIWRTTGDDDEHYVYAIARSGGC